MLRILNLDDDKMIYDKSNTTLLHINNSLALPSTAHIYAFAVEYMKQWFLSKFSNNYFKAININESHLLKNFKNFSIQNTLKVSRPSLFITPQVEFDWDRDKLDLYQSGLNLYTRRSNINRAFFKDHKHNSYLGIALDELKMNFNFKCRVETRAQQIDLFKYMNMAFRVGSTQGKDITIEMHIPYNVIYQLAKDVGFEIDHNNKRIKNISKFMRYLNKHSLIPIIFKYRKMTGSYEFFLLINKAYVHISCLDTLSTDDGEDEGMTLTNFMVELNAELKMPSAKMYTYYSLEEHNELDILTNTDSNELQLGVYNIRRHYISDYNEKNWNLYLKTDYVEDEINIPLEINLREIIAGELLLAIEYQSNMYLSSDMFIEFKLYNDDQSLQYTVDWNNLILKSANNIKHPTTSIGIYVDLAYLRETIEKMNLDNK